MNQSTRQKYERAWSAVRRDERTIRKLDYLEGLVVVDPAIDKAFISLVNRREIDLFTLPLSERKKWHGPTLLLLKMKRGVFGHDLAD